MRVLLLPLLGIRHQENTLRQIPWKAELRAWSGVTENSGRRSMSEASMRELSLGTRVKLRKERFLVGTVFSGTDPISSVGRLLLTPCSPEFAWICVAQKCSGGEMNARMPVIVV